MRRGCPLSGCALRHHPFQEDVAFAAIPPRIALFVGRVEGEETSPTCSPSSRPACWMSRRAGSGVLAGSPGWHPAWEPGGGTAQWKPGCARAQVQLLRVAAERKTTAAGVPSIRA